MRSDARWGEGFLKLCPIRLLPNRVFGAATDISVDKEVDELAVILIEAQQMSPGSQGEGMLHTRAGDGEDRSPVVRVAASQREDLPLISSVRASGR